MTYQASKCRDQTCGAPIIWAITVNGKRMPVDAEPAPDGTILIQAPLNDTARSPRATVVDPATPPLDGWDGELHHSHFETCPASDQFRNTKA